jgi:glycosyltransferase involved in cell wall biosynthesis
MDLSIIVPVYNVEKYVRACIESIFRQGLDESRFEVIIVNDGSIDRSMEMIADIVSQHDNVTIINQENQSLSVARNVGITAAKGEYIMMPDSDDFLIENSLAPLLDKAIETKVDLVVADFLVIDDRDMHKFSGVVQKEFSVQEKTGQQLFMEDLDPRQCYVWRTLYRKQFLLEHHISFIRGINYQDVPYTHKCYLNAKRCLKASWLLYVYRLNRPGAATTKFTVKKSRSYSIAMASTWNLRTIMGLSPAVLYKLEEDVYRSFCMMVYHTIYSIKERDGRKKVMDILRHEAPHLNFTHGIRQRLTSFMLRNMPYTFIELYYLYGQIVFRKVWKIWKR